MHTPHESSELCQAQTHVIRPTPLFILNKQLRFGSSTPSTQPRIPLISIKMTSTYTNIFTFYNPLGLLICKTHKCCISQVEGSVSKHLRNHHSLNGKDLDNAVAQVSALRSSEETLPPPTTVLSHPIPGLEILPGARCTYPHCTFLVQGKTKNVKEKLRKHSKESLHGEKLLWRPCHMQILSSAKRATKYIEVSSEAVP